MPCHHEGCSVTADLQRCEFCGHPCCADHRGDQDGLTSCTDCIKAAHQQRAARKARQAAQATGSPSSEQAPPAEPVQVAERPAPPLPEATPRVAPFALIAALPAGAYLFWFLGWLQVPAWLRGSGTALGAVFVFLTVWVIARSRIGRSRA